jgi:hypothetical protein
MTAVENEDLSGIVDLNVDFIPKVEGEQYEPAKSNRLTINYGTTTP